MCDGERLEGCGWKGEVCEERWKCERLRKVGGEVKRERAEEVGRRSSCGAASSRAERPLYGQWSSSRSNTVRCKQSPAQGQVGQ